MSFIIRDGKWDSVTETEIASEIDLLSESGINDRDLCWFTMNERGAAEITRTMDMNFSPSGISGAAYIPTPFALNGAHQWYCLGTYPQPDLSDFDDSMVGDYEFTVTETD